MSLEPSHLKAEHPQLPQSFIIGEKLQSYEHFHIFLWTCSNNSTSCSGGPRPGCTTPDGWVVISSSSSRRFFFFFSFLLFFVSDPMAVQLVNGPSRCAGRVEVLERHQWGTVCDDNWDIRDANVVCWQLGCGVAIAAPGLAHFGRGSGPIWLSEVNCTGTEDSLSKCRARPKGVTGCHHGEDASVVCSGSCCS